MIAPSGTMVTSKKARTSFLVRDMEKGVGASTLQGTEELQGAAESNGALLQLAHRIKVRELAAGLKKTGLGIQMEHSRGAHDEAQSAPSATRCLSGKT